jgi:hypothetical protein
MLSRHAWTTSSYRSTSRTSSTSILLLLRVTKCAINVKVFGVSLFFLKTYVVFKWASPLEWLSWWAHDDSCMHGLLHYRYARQHFSSQILLATQLNNYGIISQFTKYLLYVIIQRDELLLIPHIWSPCHLARHGTAVIINLRLRCVCRW